MHARDKAECSTVNESQARGQASPSSWSAPAQIASDNCHDDDQQVPGQATASPLPEEPLQPIHCAANQSAVSGEAKHTVLDDSPGDFDGAQASPAEELRIQPDGNATAWHGGTFAPPLPQLAEDAHQFPTVDEPRAPTASRPRQLSGYTLWVRQNKAAITIAVGKKGGLKAFGAEAGRRWRGLSAEERAAFNNLNSQATEQKETENDEAAAELPSPAPTRQLRDQRGGQELTQDQLDQVRARRQEALNKKSQKEPPTRL